MPPVKSKRPGELQCPPWHYNGRIDGNGSVYMTTGAYTVEDKNQNPAAKFFIFLFFPLRLFSLPPIRTILDN